MPWIFWSAIAIIAYTYLGYCGIVWARSRWHPHPTRRAAFFPRISIILIVRNEERSLPAKLKNLTRLSYPSDLTEILVVSDGSTDQTNRILSQFAISPGCDVILNPQCRGKASGLNDAIRRASGEIVIFTDVRQTLEEDAVGLLVENFADESTGCVSGELMLGSSEHGESSRGIASYWHFEKQIREMEAVSGSTIGATGAFYAVRRKLLVPLPPETILDDVFIPMEVIREGYRVLFDSRARAWDVPDHGREREFSRKVRTLTGNYQLLRLAPWLLTRENPVRFRFVSHKLMRLVVPFALLALFFSSSLIPGPIYRAALAAQIAFYVLSLCVFLVPRRGLLSRLADAAFTFVLLNAAAFVAFANFVGGREIIWSRGS
jgi:poly-beta-1,6-N-acetyl-D-glucosamine synthase